MKPGRNDPCHCGSGKKYKKCHLDEDLARERAEKSLGTLAEWVDFHARGMASGLRGRAADLPAVHGAAERFFAGTDRPADPLGDDRFLQHVLFDLPTDEEGEARLIGDAEIEPDSDAAEQKAGLRDALAESIASFFEVSEVRRGASLRLTDRVLDRTFVVRDAALADTLDPLEIVLGRVITVDKRSVLLGGWERVFFHGRKAAVASVQAALEAADLGEEATARRAWLEGEAPRLFVAAREADALRARFGM